jgi:PAS domain-containing protein
MKAASKTKAELTNEIEELRKPLKEAEEKVIAYQKNDTRPLPSQKLARTIRDADSQMTGGAMAIMDITAHRQAEMKYSQILATTLSGFWISDPQGRLLEVNDALCRMLGYTREELLTMSIADIEAAESSADVLNHIAALQTG